MRLAFVSRIIALRGIPAFHNFVTSIYNARGEEYNI